MSGFDPNDPFNDEEFQFETVELVDTSEINTRVQKAYKKHLTQLQLPLKHQLKPQLILQHQLLP